MDLRQLRQKRGKSLEDVAAAVGTDAGNLSRIERGIQLPSGQLAQRIADFYGKKIHLIWCPKSEAGPEILTR